MRSVLRSIWASGLPTSGTRISQLISNPRTAIVATGAYERPALIPGWTLPGVMTTGAAQTLLRAYQTAPGTRVLVAGNGPLNLQVAGELVAVYVDDVIQREDA